MINFYVFPILITERLKLRKLDVDDIPALVRQADNKKISKYILNIPHPYREPDAAFRLGYVNKGFKDRKRFVFAITDKVSNEFLGEIGIHLEGSQKAQLGYWIGEAFWTQGYAREAIQAVTQFGFEKLELDHIFALCHEENIASQKVVMHNGYKEANRTGKVVQFVKFRS